MKKLLAVILAVAVCFSLAACVMEKEPIKDTPDTTSQSGGTNSQTAKNSFGLNETAVFSNLKFTASEFKESNGANFFTPQDGNVFIGVKFTIENISDTEQNISSLLFFEGYADDVKCSYSISAVCAFDSITLDGSIAPGKKLVGWYALEIPENWSTVEIDVKASIMSSKQAKFVFTK